jgi:hypothetical protein
MQRGRNDVAVVATVCNVTVAKHARSSSSVVAVMGEPFQVDSVRWPSKYDPPWIAKDVQVR